MNGVNIVIMLPAWISTNLGYGLRSMEHGGRALSFPYVYNIFTLRSALGIELKGVGGHVNTANLTIVGWVTSKCLFALGREQDVLPPHREVILCLG